MLEMRVNGATSTGVTLVHVFPPSRVRWISPSSDPVQISPFTRGDSARAKIVAYYSAVVWSRVIGPPETPSIAGSCRVRSGEIGVQLCPSFTDLNSALPPMYNTRGSCGEIKSGAVHWKRYFPSPAGCPSGLSGQGSI